ncbi:larval cuticle protein A2B-like [Helicoverpa armigera]|uniref:larval cuticle protein A2B-like n=1 Tax=Helicoverpa armigera TaxID=29058 RepID=UPI003082A824
MAFKFVILACFVAVARAGLAPAAVAAPLVAAAPVAARLEEFDPVPQYNFGYNVADSLTGDYKSQTEQRNGDLVQGQYSLVDSDGTRRVVDYTADSVNGFNAVVRKEPLVAAAPAVVAEPAVVPARLAAAPVAAAPVAAAPVVAARYAAAPVAYTAAYAPAARLAYPAPVAAAYTSSFARYAAAPFAYPAAAPVVAV